MKVSLKDFFSKCEQIYRQLRICSNLLMKSLAENFIFCTVSNSRPSVLFLAFTLQYLKKAEGETLL